MKLASAGSLEAIGKMIGEYFYSSTVTLIEKQNAPGIYEVHNSKGHLVNFSVYKKGKRYIFANSV